MNGIAGSHSGPDVAIQDRAVGVDASVPEKRPVATHGLGQRRIAPRYDDLLRFARFGDVAAERIRDEGMPEEGDAVGARLVFVADAIRRGDVDAVGDRMRPLNGAPGLDLRASPFVLLRRMPADGGG